MEQTNNKFLRVGWIAIFFAVFLAAVTVQNAGNGRSKNVFKLKDAERKPYCKGEL